MKRYVRTQDNRIIDLNSGEYIVNGKDLILHKKYETVGGLPSNPETNIQLSVAVITQHNEYVFVGTITKEADTIEELCDEFVVLNPCENNRPMLMTGLYVDINRNLLIISYVGEDKLNDEDYCFPNELSLDKANVYGAIWTNKGLIYVAKMNNKGELELL